MVHKCQNCNQAFAKSEELQSHSMQCGSVPSWDHSADRMMQATAHYTSDGGIQHNIEFTGGLGIVGTPIHEHSSGIADDFINVDLFQQADPLKGYEQPTPEFHDFFSSISSALSEGSASPSTSSDITSTTGFPFPYASQRSGSTSSSSNTSPSPPNFFPTGPYISPEERANSIAKWNKYNMMASAVDRPNASDKPMYTRKQVEDMLDVVGNCFLETIDAVLQRTQVADLPLGQEIAELQTLTGSHGSSLGVEARRMILVETIPRLMASLQTLRSEDGFGAIRHPIPP